MMIKVAINFLQLVTPTNLENCLILEQILNLNVFIMVIKKEVSVQWYLLLQLCVYQIGYLLNSLCKHSGASVAISFHPIPSFHSPVFPPPFFFPLFFLIQESVIHINGLLVHVFSGGMTMIVVNTKLCSSRVVLL